MASITRHDAEQQVRSWGFPTVYTWTDGPHAHYPPHRHGGLTIHLVLSGEFTICYLEEAPGNKETYRPGARIDVAAGKIHEVWMGKDGCVYVIGE